VEETDWKSERGLTEEDSDDELEEKYANIEVNFDDSETEEEDYVPWSVKSSSKSVEEDLSNDFINKEDKNEDFPDEFLIYENRFEEDYVSEAGSFRQGKNYIEDDIYLKPGIKSDLVDNIHYEVNHGIRSEPSEIDMQDPAVLAAATKIQSVFKGFKTRKNIFCQHGYKCD